MGFDSISIILAIGAIVFALFYVFEDKKHAVMRDIFLIAALGFVYMALVFNPNITTSTTSTLTPAYSAVMTNSTNINYATSYAYFYLSPSQSAFNATDPFNALDAFQYGIYTGLSNTLPADNGHFKLAQFITYDPLGLSTLSKGIYQIHLHASSDENSVDQLYSQLWVVAPNDNNFYMVGQTPLSQQLNGQDEEYVANFYNNQTTIVSPADYLALFVFINQTTFGSPDTITLYMGGIANSHVSLPTTVSTSANQITFYPSTNTITSLNETYGSNNTISFSQPTILIYTGIFFTLLLIFVAQLIHDILHETTSSFETLKK